MPAPLERHRHDGCCFIPVDRVSEPSQPGGGLSTDQGETPWHLRVCRSRGGERWSDGGIGRFGLGWRPQPPSVLRGRVRRGRLDEPAGSSSGRADSGSPRRPAKALGSCSTARAVRREGVIDAHPTAWLKAIREGTPRGGHTTRLRRVHMVRRTVVTRRRTELQRLSALRRIGFTAEGSRLARNRRPCRVSAPPGCRDRNRSGQHGSDRARRRRPESHGITNLSTRAKARRDSPYLCQGSPTGHFGCMIPACWRRTPRATFTASSRPDPCTSPFPGSHRPASIVGTHSAKSAQICRSVAGQPTDRRHPPPATSRYSQRAHVGPYSVAGSPYLPRGQESGWCPRADAALLPAPPSSASPADPNGRVSCMAGQPGFLSLPYLQ